MTLFNYVVDMPTQTVSLVTWIDRDHRLDGGEGGSS